MKGLRFILLMVAMGGATSTFAQGFCAEGRMRDGACVNPGLASEMRTTGIVLSQPKLSQTGPVVLSDPEGLYDLPRDRTELLLLHRRLETGGGRR
jgi:hypothetical protein